jgi:hypothetical protein
MSKESLLKLLLEDTPRDELREVIQEIMKRDESIRDAVIRERVAEAAKQMEEPPARERKKQRPRAHTHGARRLARGPRHQFRGARSPQAR